MRHVERRVGRDRREVLQDVVGLTLGRGRVDLCCDRPVPVRVRQMDVLPGLRRRVEALLSDLARGDHQDPLLVVDRIAVHVHVVEVVVLTEPLYGLQVLLQHRRPPHADVRYRPRVVRDLFRRQRARRNVALLRLDRAEAERGVRRVDVVLDVRHLVLLFVRLDPELLHEGGVDGPQQHGDKREELDRDYRQAPLPEPDVGEEQDRADHGDDREEVERRELRLHVGVGRALDDPTG